MGVVYTAQDPRLKRQVAIKLLTAELTRDETAKQRLGQPNGLWAELMRPESQVESARLSAVWRAPTLDRPDRRPVGGAAPLL